MSAFEISLAAVDDQEADVGDEIEAVATDDGYTLRQSEDAWLSAEEPVEVKQ